MLNPSNIKKVILSLATFLFMLAAHAQFYAIRELMDQGIALHDEGKYAEAIKKYDEVIAKDSKYVDAYYEKAYSLYSMKKLDECMDLCKSSLSRFKNEPACKRIYMIYGNCLDDVNNPEKAIDIYEKGIKLFPDFSLLYFNKGVTLDRLGKKDESLLAFEKAVNFNPSHASSHKGICILQAAYNHTIPSLLAGLAFLCYEPEGDRAVQVLEIVKKQLYGNVKTDGQKNVITLDVSDFDVSGSRKKKENDFSMLALMLTLSGGLDKDSTLKTTSEQNKLDLKLQMLTNSLEEQRKQSFGFYWEVYVPFFIEMKKEKQIATFSHIAFASDKDDANTKWLDNHKNEVEAFYEWLKNYQWQKEKK